MNIEQIIKLVEKWLADPSSVTGKELEAAATSASNCAFWDTTANAAANAAVNAAANATWAAATTRTAIDANWAAKHVAKYHELTK